MENEHISVLLEEAIMGLNIKEDGIYVDCTLGGGGHASLILSKIPKGHLYAFDQDAFAIAKASNRLAKIANNFTVINDNFCNLKSELANYGINSVDGILFDLGVSSFQLDMPERGFSYRFDGPLDMRMNPSNELTAYHIVNFYSEEKLKEIIFNYGEEKYAPLIAKKICQVRKDKPLSTTLELVDVIKKALPSSALRKEAHPAKKTFQAIRIEVNNELDVLKQSLKDALDMLNPHGRLVVISFHSLEDRIVKHLFKEKTSLNLPKGLPFIPDGYKVDFMLINKKIITPNDKEISKNLRSHSAKMRIIEKKD